MKKPSKEILKILAEKIKKYRISKGLSQEEFAHLCGLHRTYIGSVERCERNITLSTLEIFTKTLEVEIPQLITK